MEKTDKIKAYSAWGAVCIFWGTTYLAIRIGVSTLPPALFAGTRFILAGMIFLPILLLRGYTLPQKRDLPAIAIIAFALLAAANGTVVWAEQWVPSGLASLIVATLPFWMVGIEGVISNGEKLNFKKILGILIGFSGLVLLLWPDLKGTIDPAYLKGLLVILIAPMSWSAGSIYSKYRKINAHPLIAAALQMLIAGVILVVVGVVSGEVHRFNFDLKGFAAMGYLVVFGSIIGYSSYIYALSKLPSSIVSMYAYINPVIAVLLGWLLLDERLDWFVIVATTVILSGVVLVKTGQSRLKKSAHTPITKERELGKEELV